jgi:predicted secreted Zn-dependent protease
VSSIDTDLDLKLTLPSWTPPAGASGDLVSRWERYLAALRLHEDGHLDHGRGAEKAFRAVAAATSAADCGSLDRALRERFSQVIADYQGRDREYDRRTEHGKSQGAFFR